MFTLIIADDEKAACKRLELFTKREFPDIEIVAIVNDGYELVRSAAALMPDIAIVDMNMPGMNGIQAIRILHERKVNTRFIINTAYDEFDYVKQALDMKVDAYLLKPEKKEHFLETVRKVCDSIRRDREEEDSRNRMNSLLTGIHSVVESDIVYSVLMKEPSEHSMRMYCDMNHIQFCGAAMATILPTGFEERLRAPKKNVWNEIVHRALDSLCNCIVNATDHGINLIILVQPLQFKDRQETENWIRDLVWLAVEELRREYPMHFRAGIGGFYESLSELSRSYQESLEGLYRKNPEAKEEEKGDEKGEGLEKWQEELERIHTLCRMDGASDYVKEAICYIGQNFARDISLDSVAEAIGISSYYLSRIISQELGITFVEYLTGLRIVEAAKLAATTRLSLKQIAERTGYPNDAYLCRVFKKYAGKTIGQIRREEQKTPPQPR